MRAQAEVRGGAQASAAPPGPLTLDDAVAEAQAVGLMFGANPLEVGKAIRKSWPPKAGDLEAVREKLRRRTAT